MRRRNADGLDARHLRGNHGHQQCRWQRITAGGNVRAHRFERPDDLAQPAAIRKLNPGFLWKLQLRIFANVLRGSFERGHEVIRNTGVRC